MRARPGWKVREAREEAGTSPPSFWGAHSSLHPACGPFFPFDELCPVFHLPHPDPPTPARQAALMSGKGPGPACEHHVSGPGCPEVAQLLGAVLRMKHVGTRTASVL